MSFLISVIAPTPKTSDLRVFTGPDFIYLDWPVQNDGWASNYTIEVEPMNATFNDESMIDANSTSLRNDRKLPDAFYPSSTPPFNLSNLVPENEYKILITTSLNDKFKTTFVLEDVFTTANESRLPEGIIGVRETRLNEVGQTVL